MAPAMFVLPLAILALSWLAAGQTPAPHDPPASEPIEDEPSNKLRDFVKAYTIRDQNLGRSLVLSQVAIGLGDLLANIGFHNWFYYEAIAGFERLVWLPFGEASPNFIDTLNVNKIVEDKAVAFFFIFNYLNDNESHEYLAVVQTRSPHCNDKVVIKFPSESAIISWSNENSSKGFEWTSKGRGFSVATQCDSLHRRTHMIFVVYRENVCPMRPLPIAEFPITRLQVVEMIIDLERAKYGDDSTYHPVHQQTPENAVDTDVIILQWVPKSNAANLRHSCAYWTGSEWSSDDCIVFKSVEIPSTVSCYCYLQEYSSSNASDKTVTFEYILYEYQEDIEPTIRTDTSNPVSDLATGTSDSELEEYTSRLSGFVSSAESPSSYIDFLLQMSTVMRLDSALLSNVVDDAVVKDIGKILRRVKPDAGTSTIGTRNNDLASFVIDVGTYNRNPPIGFGVYNQSSYGMEYFRLEEEMDYSVIFAVPFVYSFLFSKSVVVQNSRYAFLLYPPDKFFKPLAAIDGHQVSTMRVLDIVLIPKNTRRRDIFVHMFTDKIISAKGLGGCAYWSASLGDWTSAHCHLDHDLSDGVCTCNMTANFAESPTRGQYVVYTYVAVDFEPSNNLIEPNSVEENDHKLKLQLTVFSVYERTKYDQYSCQNNVTDFMWADSDNKVVPTSAEQQRISRLTVLKNYCAYNTPFTNVSDHIAVCSDIYVKSASKITVLRKNGFACELFNRTLQTYFKGDDASNVADVFSKNVSYALHLSPSVLTRNEMYLLVFYPIKATPRPPPSMPDRAVDSFRVVDIILQPKVDAVDRRDQFVWFYLDHPKYLKTGCASWSDALGNWTARGCTVATVNSVDVCKCNMTSDSLESQSGSQYVVYSYTTHVFDDGVYEVLGSESITDEGSILKYGLALIQNGSELLKDSDEILAKKIIHVYQKLLVNVGDLLLEKNVHIDLLENLEQAFSRFYVDPLVPVSFIHHITTSWSVKNAEISNDLYSNAVLSADAVDRESTEVSDFALAVIGHLNKSIDSKLFGIQFPRSGNHDGTYANWSSITSAIAANPQFACFWSCQELLKYYRFIFIVHPLNLSPYPYSLSQRPMFNTRQVGVYIDTGNVAKNYYGMIRPKCATIIHVHFQPTEHPKDYIKIGCATWDSTGDRWTEDLCTLDILYKRNVSCKCNLSKRSVTRIMMYEYTELVNLSFLAIFDGPIIVFIASSSFSLFGFIMIAATAILFPSWREERSNKVLMHLASSSFLYLCMTMFRETHLIYADLKHLDVALVAFTACLYYTRLVHHCWGLVMSVLQYKRFSSVVGASATSHILLKISLLAWGVPLVAIVALLSWDVRAHFCSPDKLTHYVLYLVPVVIIVLLNCGFLFAIIRNMTNGCGRWDDEELKKHGVSSKDVMMRQIKQTVLMFFLFGIPTIFEMFNDIVFHSEAMDYIDKVLNPIQGFVMFLFFVVMNDKTRALWNIHVLGDAPPPTAATPSGPKHIVFKLKALKKVSNLVDHNMVSELHAEVKQSTSAGSEIPNIANNLSKIAMKYITQPPASSVKDSSVEKEGDNAECEMTSESREKLDPFDVIPLYLAGSSDASSSDNALEDNGAIQQRMNEVIKQMECLIINSSVKLQPSGNVCGLKGLDVSVVQVNELLISCGLFLNQCGIPSEGLGTVVKAVAAERDSE